MTIKCNVCHASWGFGGNSKLALKALIMHPWSSLAIERVRR